LKIFFSKLDFVFKKEYFQYLFRQYPDLVLNKKINSKEYVLSIIQKIIYEDSEKYIKNVDKDILYKICMIIFRDPGQIYNYLDLSRNLNIKRKIVSEYVGFLINSGIIRKIYNFSNNARKLEIKSKKLYPYCTTLTKVVGNYPNIGKIIETDVAFQLDAKYFVNNKGKEEIDFLLFNEITSKKIGVEVKYKNLITNKDVNNFKSSFVKKLNLDKRIIVIKDESKLDFDLKDIISIKYYTIFKNKNLFFK
jgi:predicted AAA+ superfamily ATPase